MDMEKLEIIAVPLPFQGHLNPMLQFCSCLSARGHNITLVLTHAVAKSMRSTLSQSVRTVEIISDGNDDDDPARTFAEWRARTIAAFCGGVAAVIEKHNTANVIVHDAILPWLLDVGRARGLRVATFFTQPASLCAVYHHMLRGHNVKDNGNGAVRWPSLPAMELRDLPSFSYYRDNEEEVMEFSNQQALNLPKADCFLFNTFDALEDEVLTWMAAKKWAVKTVGPLVPTLHKSIKDGKQDRIDLFELDGESYTKWLDAREPKSVVYSSFGSFVAISEEQMEEVAWGLAQSNKYFIWVVREPEEVKLPKDFKSKTSGKGVIVKWCPQIEVLSHKAIACFMTHCGWNSTLEALCLGVPIVGIPQVADQPTNAKLIEDVWEIGVRVKVNEKGIVTRDEIDGCIKQVTEGVKAEKFRRNVMKWKGLAEEATMVGGSSDMNIKDFISQLAFAKTNSK